MAKNWFVEPLETDFFDFSRCYMCEGVVDRVSAWILLTLCASALLAKQSAALLLSSCSCFLLEALPPGHASTWRKILTVNNVPPEWTLTIIAFTPVSNWSQKLKLNLPPPLCSLCRCGTWRFNLEVQKGSFMFITNRAPTVAISGAGTVKIISKECRFFFEALIL